MMNFFRKKMRDYAWRFITRYPPAHLFMLNLLSGEEIVGYEYCRRKCLALSDEKFKARLEKIRNASMQYREIIEECLFRLGGSIKEPPSSFIQEHHIICELDGGRPVPHALFLAATLIFKKEDAESLDSCLQALMSEGQFGLAGAIEKIIKSERAYIVDVEREFHALCNESARTFFVKKVDRVKRAVRARVIKKLGTALFSITRRPYFLISSWLSFRRLA